ncbi:Major facilitator superfamily [Globisporangium polare]
MELDVLPLAGWKYKSLEKQYAVNRSLFRPPGNAKTADDHDGLSSSPLSPSVRGCCWNPLTKCFLVCDPVRCCVRVYRVSIVTNDEQHEHGLLEFSLNTDMEKIGGKGTGSGKFMNPVAVDVNSRGEIAVADAKLSRVQVFMGSGTLQYYFGRPGGSRGEFRNISDLKFTLLGHLAIVDTGNHRIQIMTQAGGIVMIIGKPGWRRGEFASPSAIDIARNGDLFICDQGNKRIQRLTAKGKVITVWGSRRQAAGERKITSDELDEFGLPASATLTSVFDSPSDIAISANGEIVVSDSGPTTNQILFFSDTGTCRHVLKCPPPWQPIAINYCSDFFVVISRSPIEHSGSQQNEADPGADPATSESSLSSTGIDTYEYMLTSYSAIKRVAVGKLESWPVRCVVQTLRFLTYSDAMQIRLVNHFFHDACHTLRNEWKLFPLTPGVGTVRKYNQVVAPSTGLVAVTEAFDKWGLRVFKPSNRIRRHVMDFESGFCNAISALYGAMFRFQHEEILRALFRHHAYASGTTGSAVVTSRRREEIDRAAFVEIVTLIEEVRAGFLKWEQCAAFQRSVVDTHQSVSPSPPLTPCVRTTEVLPVDTSAQGPPSLRLVETAQQHQMNKLLLKLRSL